MRWHSSAYNQSSGDVLQLTEVIKNTALQALCGDDTLMLTTFLLGGDGALSTAAYIRPDLYVRMYALMQAGEVARVRAIFDDLLPLIRLLFSEPNPGPIKASLALQNRIEDTSRLPMTTMSASGRRRLAIALERVMDLPRYLAPVDAGAIVITDEYKMFRRKMAIV
ncbi:dihydrodipicolinate synthase family protein [Glaciimonas sp. GG7]